MWEIAEEMMMPYVMRPHVRPKLASYRYTFHVLALAPIYQIHAVTICFKSKDLLASFFST